MNETPWQCRWACLTDAAGPFRRVVWESDRKLVQFRGCLLPPSLRSVAPRALPGAGPGRGPGCTGLPASVTPAGPMAAGPPAGPPGSGPGRAEPAVHAAHPSWAESGTWCHPHPFPPEQGDKLPPRKLRLIIWFPIMLVGCAPGPAPAGGASASTARPPPCPAPPLWQSAAGFMSTATFCSVHSPLRNDGEEGRRQTAPVQREDGGAEGAARSWAHPWLPGWRVPLSLRGTLPPRPQCGESGLQPPLIGTAGAWALCGASLCCPRVGCLSLEAAPCGPRLSSGLLSAPTPVFLSTAPTGLLPRRSAHVTVPRMSPRRHRD